MEGRELHVKLSKSIKGIRGQALQVALYGTWLAGLLFIVVSLYATQLLPGLVEQESQAGNPAVAVKVTIFSVPQPFEGMVGESQAQAVYSWLRLSLDLQVVLIGRHQSLKSFAARLHPRVAVESDIDFTFSDAPLFHSIIARTTSSNSDISVLIESNFILTQDFVDTLEHIQNLQHDWLLVAGARSISGFPYSLKHSLLWIGENGQLVGDEQVHAYVKGHGLWQPCTGKFIWAWNTESVPLHVGVMPSFVHGYGFHNEWLLNEALSSGLRFVFDASDAISAFYLSQSESDPFLNSGPTFARGNTWEAENNAHLAALYGSFYFRPVHFVNAPAKLVRCGDPNLKVFRFLYPLFALESFSNTEIVSSSSGHQPVEMQQDFSSQQLWNESFLTNFRRFGLAKWQMNAVRYPCQSAEVTVKRRGHLKNKLMIGKLKVKCNCIDSSEDLRLDCPSSKMRKLPRPVPSRSSLVASAESMPMPLDSLLSKVSDSRKIVVLSVVGNNYRDMLMNWVCRLRKLQISNFIVGAVDADLYDFALLQGLPVFMSGPSMDLSFNDCHFGTDCFRRVTKVKSRTVLQILKLGYSVLFSDVDVYWFKNPLDYLTSFGPGTVVAQSDEWNVTEAANKPRRLNSGFYFAWSDFSTVAVFEKIVKHASASNMSEQPSFYDILCGESGRYRQGDLHCVEPEYNLTTHFLSREEFPNGGYKELWQKKNVSEACELQGCFILHNNWVSGRQRKFDRQIDSGLWDYDVRTRICLRSWHGH